VLYVQFVIGWFLARFKPDAAERSRSFADNLSNARPTAGVTFRPVRPGPDRIRSRNCDFRANVMRDVRMEFRLSRIKAERLELPAPFCRRIAKPLNANATGQATLRLL
jgi:hypothetical protein